MRLRIPARLSTCLPALLLSLLLTSSCSKEDQEDIELFYGKWEAYGDTITFSRTNGMNIMNGWPVWSSAMSPSTMEREFSYQKGKLALRDIGAHGFTRVKSFQWVSKPTIFSLNAEDWSIFTPTALGQITFKKIQ